MEKSSLLQLVRSFSAVEIREIRKFLKSPFFNQRQDVIDLFEHMTGANKDMSKPKVWIQIFGESTPYDEPRLRLLMSYLHVLLEQYLSVRELMSDPFGAQIQLASAYRRRKMPAAFERTRKNIIKSLEAQPLRNAAYHEQRYRLDMEVHLVAYATNPTDVSLLRTAGESLDVAFMAQKLQIVCQLLAHQTVYHSDQEESWERETVEAASQSHLAHLPAISIYLHCYQMLRNPSEESHFQAFKTLLLNESRAFLTTEIHGLYILAINYCVRRINAGELRFYAEVLDLYKVGLEQGYLLDDSVLSRFTYHNIAAAAIHTGDLEWAATFLQTYKNRLEKRYRESAYSFNLARLEYARGNHALVLELLQKANYRDPLLNLAAKTLLLKTYFDLNETDTLQSQLDAMRNYLHRKRVLGYHRTNYLNLIRYAEKILRLQPGDRAAADALRKAIEKEEVLSEKAFLLGVMG